MRPLLKGAVVVAVNILLLLVLLEAAGVATFYAKNGHLFYRRPEFETSPQPAESPANTQLHPILGFANRAGLPVTEVATRQRLDGMIGPGQTPPWASLRANNFGFFASHDYPYAPPDGTFLIGVFGGSVAQWFSLQGGPTLVDRLQRLPGLENRRIEVLNFAQGSFKQPQQLQILAYFLSTGQTLDLVLNIDGFNEVALFLLNTESGIDPTMPASGVLLPLRALVEKDALSLEQIEIFASAKRRQKGLEILELRTAGARFAAAWLVFEARRQLAARRYSSVAAKLAEGGESRGQALISVNAWPSATEPDDPFEFFSSVWMEASVLMNNILRGQGVPYLHVIQPNQYFSKKTFSEGEKRGAVSSDSPYSKGARTGYPYLLERIPAMRSRGVSVVSAVELFDAETETIYADNCCHFNQVGNEILADFIASHIDGFREMAAE